MPVPRARLAIGILILAILATVGLWVLVGSAGEGTNPTSESKAGVGVSAAASHPAESPEAGIVRADAPETTHLNSAPAFGERRRKPGVRVRVFAHDGSPAEDVAVAVLAVRKYRTEQIGWTHFTDADGRAFLEMSCPSQDERPDRYRITAAIPLAEPCETLINWENYADEHILTLPPTGQVEVLLRDEARAAYLGWAQVGIRPHLADREPPTDMGDFNFDWASDYGALFTHATEGRGLFPWIGLGLDLDIGMEWEVDESFRLQTGKGPSQTGATVRFQFGELPILTLLEIPILDPSGAPLRNERVSASRTAFANCRLGGENTDDNGILTLIADTDLREGRDSFLFAREFAISAPWGAKWKEPVCAAGTRTRLPAIQLQEVPVNAAGVVLHADGRREPNAEISVYSPSQNSYSMDLWIVAPLNHDAEFFVYGFNTDSSLRIDARLGWRYGGANLRPGALDHRLVLSGDEERPAWVEFDDLEFMHMTEMRIGYQSWNLEDDATFLNSGTHGEPATLEVRDRFSDEVLVALEGVSPLPGNSPRDERLRPLDLRGKLRKVRVVWDPSESEVPDWSIALDPPLDRSLDFCEVDDRAVEFLTARESLNLWINAAGFRPRLYQDVREKLEVKLERAFPVTLRLTDPEILIASPWTRCFLLPQFDSQGLDDTFLYATFEAQGRVTAWLPEAGEYLLYLILAGPRGMLDDEDHAWIEIGMRDIQESPREEVVIEVSAAEAAAAWRTRDQ